MTLHKLRRHILPVIVGIGIVVFTLFFQITSHPLLEQIRDRLEWTVYDLRLQATLPDNPKPHPSVIIIDIDDKSLSAEGHWPWPRAKLAHLLDKLSTAGVVVTAFDFIFSEHEENIATRLLDILEGTAVDTNVKNTLSTVAREIDGDDLFAKSLGNKEVVMGFAFLNDNNEFGKLGHALPISNLDELNDAIIPKQTGHLASIERLQVAGKYSGFINARPDSDGLIRRSSLIHKHNDKIYPSLALEAVRLLNTVDNVNIKTTSISGLSPVEYISLGFYDIPTDATGSILVPFRGPPYSFRYISATDVLHDRIDPSVLAGTIAFVGTTATGLFDIRPTPVSSAFPGVEVQASIAAGIIDMKFPFAPVWASGVSFTITFLVGALLALLLPFMSPQRSIILFLSVSFALIVFNAWLWREHQFVVAISSPLIMIFLLVASNSLYGFLYETRGRKHLREQFGQYVPPALVDQMITSDDDLGFDGDRRDMTVLFADIRNFTTISESLSATELKDMLNRFFTPMTEVIFNTNGTIDKYVGDMIMAFWGAPLKDPDHAQHAIQAALMMLAKVKELKTTMADLGYPEIKLGIGLNSGTMNVGNMGSEYRRSYTVLGDAVNLSSRLEALTKFYGVELIVGENTRAGQDSFVFRRLDKVRVKGKLEPVFIYEPICHIADANEHIYAELNKYETALTAYYSRDWESSKQAFQQLQANAPGKKIYSIYLERIASLEGSLSDTDEWDGTFTHTRK